MRRVLLYTLVALIGISLANPGRAALAFPAQSGAAPSSIGEAKAQPDGTSVVLEGKCVTWSPRDTNGLRSTDFYYIEDLDRTSAIRVKNPPSTTDNLRVNDTVSVSGTKMTDADTGEHYIEASSAPTGTPGIGIAAYGMTTKSVQTDPLTVGMLAKVSGKVKQVASDGSWFIISDGFLINRVEEGTKVSVSGAQLPGNIAQIGLWITVVGVISKENTENGVRDVILLFNYDRITLGSETGITFLTASELHYGKSDTVATANRATIDHLNALPGTPYPSEMGGVVQNPAGIVLIGDLTEDGTVGDWNAYATDCGVNGECRIRYPAYDGLGNHDGDSAGIVAQNIRARNLLRRGLAQISDNGLHYSWDWGNVHFVNCNMVPVDIDSGDPIYALQFLKDDLAECVGSSGRPVVVFQHVDPGNSGWTSAEWTNYYNAIKDYNVIAIVHGHTHVSGHYTWNGIDVFQDGTTQYDPYPGRALVFRITQDELAAAITSYDRTQGTWGWRQFWTKPITGMLSPAVRSENRGKKLEVRS